MYLVEIAVDTFAVYVRDDKGVSLFIGVASLNDRCLLHGPPHPLEERVK